MVASIYFWLNEEYTVHHMKIFNFKEGSKSKLVCNKISTYIDEYVSNFDLILTVIFILGKG